MKLKFARAYVAKAADQHAMMKSADLPKQHVKCGDVAGQNIADPDWTLRPGELLAVNSVRDFTDAFSITAAHGEIAAAIEWVQSQGAEVYEISSGERTGKGKGAQMVSRALSRMHGAVRMKDAQAMQANSVKARLKGRMPKVEALRIWCDARRFPRYQDAIAAMTGWNKASVYKELGPRNVGAGRAPKR